MSAKREPDVWDGDSQPVRDGGDRDDDPPSQPYGVELAGADEFVGGGAADAEEVAGLGDGQGKGAIGSHDLLGLFGGQNLTRVVEEIRGVRRRHAP